MDNEEMVLLQKEEGVAILQFNRPKSLNAFNEEMLAQFKTHLLNVKNDNEVKVVIVKGKGRAFSAGVDLKTTIQEDFQKGARFMDLGHEVGDLIATMPKVMIAQVHGYCFTGALEMALFFDLIFCSDSTQFGDTHAKWGIMPRWGMTQRLARRVGLSKAKELTFRAYRVKGPEAERINLVNRSFSDGELDNRVGEIVEEIIGNSHEAIVAIKRLYDEGFLLTLKEGLELELNAETSLKETDENLKNFEKKKFSS